MSDGIGDSDRILAESRAVLRDNRAGGRHRRSGSIGEGSQSLKNANRKTRLKLFFGTVFAILAGASLFGAFVSALGFGGVMIVALALFLTLIIFAQFPKVKAPRRADLARTTDAGRLVARTELWLEGQRAALPAPAARLVDDLGVQLDALGRQLEHVDPGHPAAGDVRKLVGEILPETIETYTRIPAHLRGEQRAGSTPDAQLTQSLTRIGKEIDSVTRQLAEGSLDDLAIKTRYLDYRYGDAEGMALEDRSMPAADQGSGVPLPDFDREKALRP